MYHVADECLTEFDGKLLQLSGANSGTDHVRSSAAILSPHIYHRRKILESKLFGLYSYRDPCSADPAAVFLVFCECCDGFGRLDGVVVRASDL